MLGFRLFFARRDSWVRFPSLPPDLLFWKFKLFSQANFFSNLLKIKLRKGYMSVYNWLDPIEEKRTFVWKQANNHINALTIKTLNLRDLQVLIDRAFMNKDVSLVSGELLEIVKNIYFFKIYIALGHRLEKKRILYFLSFQEALKAKEIFLDTIQRLHYFVEEPKANFDFVKNLKEQVLE